jgi:hypothetical protein
MELILPERTTGAQTLKKFPAFYGTQNVITALQQPTTGPCPKPDESSPHPTHPISLIHTNIILPPMFRPS